MRDYYCINIYIITNILMITYRKQGILWFTYSIIKLIETELTDLT